MKRVVADWLHKGNRTEPAPSFFSRLRDKQQRVGDSLLVSRCQSLLRAETSLSNQFIHVRSENGSIVLRGTVPTESAKERAAAIARQTPGAFDVRNEIEVAGPVIAQASFVGAELSSPTRLDGSQFPTTTSAKPVEAPIAPSVTLGAPIIGPIEESLADPHDPFQPMPIPLTTMAMPPIQHSTIGQQVAKSPVGPTVLPSGQRVWLGSERRASIPAPPAVGPGAPVGTSPPPRARLITSSPTRPATTQLDADIAAVLAKDPRAQELAHEIRGRGVHLSGRVRNSEELFAVIAILDSVAGVDYVSFDQVRFADR